MNYDDLAPDRSDRSKLRNAITAVLGAKSGHTNSSWRALHHEFYRVCECGVESGCHRATAQALLETLRPDLFPTELYYEAHVTIDPVFDAQREQVAVIAAKHGFRLAKLIMRKREGDDEVPHEDDAFLTARDEYLANIRTATKGVVTELRNAGFIVRRYKIEDTILDSSYTDTLNILGR